MKLKAGSSWYKSEVFWKRVPAITGILILVLGLIQLTDLLNTEKANKKINSENFLHQLKIDFFSDSARKLIILIETNSLKFYSVVGNNSDKKNTPPNLGIFTVDPDPIFEKYTPDVKGKAFASDFIDMYLLNHFEDLGLLYSKNMISLKDIDEYFGYYIILCYENLAIRKYIDWSRKIGGDKDIFSKFTNLSDALEAYDHVK